MPTTDDLWNRYSDADVYDQARLVHDAITELEARDREIEQAQAREEAWRADIRSRTYALSQAKREISELRAANCTLASAAVERPPYKAELREHAERLAEALKLYADMPHRDGCECEACAALAAYRKATTTQEEA